MKTILAAGIFVAATIAGGCALAPPVEDWHRQEEASLRHLAGIISPIERESLLLLAADVVRLDGQTIIVLGSFRSAAGSMRTAIFRSADNGVTWQQADTWMAGCTACRAFVLDPQHAWVAVCWALPEELPPYYVLATSDGGRTWRRPRQGLTPSDGSPVLDRWAFDDCNKGKISFVCDDELVTFATADGGDTWSAAGRKQMAGAAVPQSDGGPGSLRASIDSATDVVLVEECVEERHWRELGRLPRVWRLADLNIEPAKK